MQVSTQIAFTHSRGSARDRNARGFNRECPLQRSLLPWHTEPRPHTLSPFPQVRVSTMLTPQLLVQRLQQAFGDSGGTGYSLERARAMIEVRAIGVGW